MTIVPLAPEVVRSTHSDNTHNIRSLNIDNIYHSRSILGEYSMVTVWSQL